LTPKEGQAGCELFWIDKKRGIIVRENKKGYHSGFVTVIGKPNVGKSSLLNALLKQKIAAVSPRPQTTRRRQLGILSLDNAQIIFIDTPGIHKPHHKLGEFMNEEAASTLQDADVIIWVVDASQKPDEEDRNIAERLAECWHQPPIFLALNKIDLITAELSHVQADYLALLPEVLTLPISARTGLGQEELLQRVIALLPEGDPFYDPEQVTDLFEREIAADLVREAALLFLQEEVPHAIAVRIDEYTERGDQGAFIGATIFVERESHKGIVIGKGGEMLKKIGSAARKEIEKMSGRKIFLELRVKVNKNWRNNLEALKLLGYDKET
jgi:GTP-binding protein Era